MAIHNNPVSVTYTDSELHNLVEEYITQQKSEFTLKGVCSYILYWAVEDGKISGPKALVESNELNNEDQLRVKRIMEAIIADGRIVNSSNGKYINS